MFGLFQLKELEARKKALAAESEVYRQTLKLEARNFWLYGLSAKRKLTQPRFWNPWVLIGPALAGFWLRRRRKRRSSFQRIASGALLGWRLYRKFSPLCHQLFTRWTNRRRDAANSSEEQTPAANI